jgi:hypothetical protein
MAKVISIHEYELKAGVDEEAFVGAVRQAVESGLIELPGLEVMRFLRGIRGIRKDKFSTLWVYTDKEAWERLWGQVDHPTAKASYPAHWLVWEEEVLAPFLDRPPDEINFTAYEEL